MTRALRTTVAAFGLFALGAANAGLLGQTIVASGFNLRPAVATIGPGAEFAGISYDDLNYIAFDFADDTLTLYPVVAQSSIEIGWFRFEPYVFSGFTSEIVDMFVESNDGFTGTLLDQFRITNNSIAIDFSEGSVCCGPDKKLTYRIITRSLQIDAPPSLTLALLALVVAGASRRSSAQSPNSRRQDQPRPDADRA